MARKKTKHEKIKSQTKKTSQPEGFSPNLTYKLNPKILKHRATKSKPTAKSSSKASLSTNVDPSLIKADLIKTIQVTALLVGLILLLYYGLTEQIIRNSIW